MRITKAQALERAIFDRLEKAQVGETVVMPWGEEVTLLGGGETHHMIPLEDREMAAKVRALVTKGKPLKALVKE